MTAPQVGQAIWKQVARFRPEAVSVKVTLRRPRTEGERRR
jgi:hypothetical protein